MTDHTCPPPSSCLQPEGGRGGGGDKEHRDWGQDDRGIKRYHKGEGREGGRRISERIVVKICSGGQEVN